jgi:protease-4
MKRLIKLMGRLLAGCWKALTFLRCAVLNLAFVALAVFVLMLVFSGRGAKLPERAALVLSLSGSIVEQRSESLLSSPLLDEDSAAETLLQDIIDAVDHAAGDPRIQAIYLDLSKLKNAGLSKLQDIGAALKRFRESGKTIVAAADFYVQKHYYLAAHADRVYVHPMGGVLLTGFGIYQNYYKSALDKLLVQFHVYKVGSYKSALEPVLRNDMSPFDKEANSALLSVLWDSYKAEVAGLRGIEPQSIDDYVNNFPVQLAASGGDAAALALSRRLVDGLKTQDEVRDELVQLVGEDRTTHGYSQVRLEDYLKSIHPSPRTAGPGQRIGLIVASGVILEGTQPAGRIGGDSLSALIRQARRDDRVRAVVLRIDSPGGSAFASDQVRRELEITRLAGKPVVVSMGSTAASGGYWIATAADEIWSAPTTITGSIGIFGAFPTFEKSLEALGVNNDGVGTTRMSDAFNPNRPMNPLLAEAMDQIMEQGYRTFIERVAEGRQMTAAAVRKIADGRVWAGMTAREIGLVDKLGHTREAIESAAQKAGLDQYTIEMIEQPLTRRERLLRHINELVVAVCRQGLNVLSPPAAEWLKMLAAPTIDTILMLNDPRGIYAYCLACGSP